MRGIEAVGAQSRLLFSRQISPQIRVRTVKIDSPSISAFGLAGADSFTQVSTSMVVQERKSAG
ncbi:hypothetical protein CCR94_19290 [Rhodoblastus sphagnicola]|uniref:Uncharacterized protein n=1 Tax=Rhodoblastus sphagnicola TaxID=333368 RepID=A0A2S6MZM4_9HYPH|nr:hypothetical protein CCR94_19290 [Rhodoblastus sphagnicola]